jgi:hypothetical protein
VGQHGQQQQQPRLRSGIIGVSNTGAPIRSNVFTPAASSDNEFFVARVGINYKFGSY